MHTTIIVYFTQSHLCSTTLIGNHPLECAEIWEKKAIIDISIFHAKVLAINLAHGLNETMLLGTK